MGEPPENVIPITKEARSAAQEFGAAHARELLTILFTDLVDSTKLQSELGNVEAARLTELHRQIVRDELARYDAREIEWAGDSCLAVFTKPSDAVVFALRMQAEHRRVREAEPKLPLVRVGMHLGEIVVKKRRDGGKKTEDLFGLQVSEAARVMSVARGDQIFCTRAVFDNARSALKGRPIEGVGEAVWVNYGAFLLKGSEEPVELCEIGSADISVLKAPEATDKVAPVLPGGIEAMRALVPLEDTSPSGFRLSPWRLAIATTLLLALGALGYRALVAEPAGRATQAMGTIQSLAVLPLDNYSNDPEQEYFVDGMTDALTAELSKVSALKIIARTSAMHYKDSDLPIRQIARELAVDGVIEGSVYRSGDDIRITAQLVRGDTEEHVWGESYEANIENVMKLQGQIAIAIVREIRAALTPEEEERISLADTTNPEAYDAYLRGRDALRGRSEGAFESAIEYFEQSIEADPGFAPAYAGKAETLGLRFNYFQDTAEIIEDARRAAQKALELNPGLSEAHAVVGFFHTLNAAEWREAEQSFRRAIELNRGNALAYTWYAMQLVSVGRLNEADSVLRRAEELDPNSVVPKAIRTMYYLHWRDFERAEALVQRMLSEHPENVLAVVMAEFLFSDQGYDPEKVAKLEALLARVPAHTMGLNIALASAYAQVGRTQEATSIREGYLRDRDGIPNFDERMAKLAFMLGEEDHGFELLGAAVPWGPVLSRQARASAEWDFIRDDPRYWELIELNGFPPLPPEHPIYEQEQAWLRKKAAEEALAAQPKPLRRLTIQMPEGVELAPSLLRDKALTISPDGRHVVYRANVRGRSVLMHRPIDALESVELPGTEDARLPRFAPDNRSLLFFAGSVLKRTSIRGGAPTEIALVSVGVGADWLDQNTVIYSPGARHPMTKRNLETGESQTLTSFAPDEGIHGLPHVLPGGRGVLFVRAIAPTLESSTVQVLDLNTGERETIIREATLPVYLETGYVVVSQADRLTAVPFDVDKLKVTGDAFQVVGESISGARAERRDFDVSRDGSLVYPLGASTRSRAATLVWVDETGAEEPIPVAPQAYRDVRISPDGKRFAVGLADLQTIFVYDVDRPSVPRRITFGDVHGAFPTWFPEGSEELIFMKRIAGLGLEVRRADGSGGGRSYPTNGRQAVPIEVLPGNEAVLAFDIAEGALGLVLLPADGSEATVLQSKLSVSGSYDLSPDGKWLAYSSTESGMPQIYVQPFPSMEGKWQVSVESGTKPSWSGDGARLFYRSNGHMMVVDVDTSDSFVTSPPRKLFEDTYVMDASARSYDRSPTEDRFLMIKAPESGAQPKTLVITQNWADEVARQDPRNGEN